MNAIEKSKSSLICHPLRHGTIMRATPQNYKKCKDERPVELFLVPPDFLAKKII
jgi:hypothetical protein